MSISANYLTASDLAFSWSRYCFQKFSRDFSKTRLNFFLKFLKIIFMYTSDQILLFCEIVRSATPNAIAVYTQGNCGAFALMLNIAFPGGKIKNAMGHRIYEYHGQWYDIEGYSKTECEYDQATDLMEGSIPQILNLLKSRHEEI